MPKLTIRVLDAIKPDPNKDVFIWCSATPGFGARIYPSGKTVFIAQVRIGRAQRRVKIGPYGAFTPDQARDEAEEIIRSASKGLDPQAAKQAKRAELTVGEICDLYLEAAKAGRVITSRGGPKKQSTVAIDVGRVERHIRPLIGKLKASAVTSAIVQRMVDDVAAGKTAISVKSDKKRGRVIVTGGGGTAARVADLFGGIWTWASKRDYVPDATVARGIDKMRSKPEERILSTDELKSLGAAIEDAKAKTPLAAAAVRLIALLGSRRQEVVKLRRQEIDFLGSCLQLGDTKTGRSTRAVGAQALASLREVSDLKLHDVYLFPNSLGSGPADLKKQIAAIFDAAGLSDVRSQTLRRTFASIGDELGYSDPIIGALLGHAKQGVTQKHYVRRPDAALISAATRISDRISAAMSDEMATNIVRLSNFGEG